MAHKVISRCQKPGAGERMVSSYLKKAMVNRVQRTKVRVCKMNLERLADSAGHLRSS